MTDSRSAAVILHARARDVLNAGDPERARVLLDEAATRARDIEEEALVAGTFAFTEAELGRTASAVARCRSVLASTALSVASRARLTGQLAYVRWLAGAAQEAIALYTEALDHLDDDDRIALLVNRGLAKLDLGFLQGARADFTEGEAGADPVASAKCRHNAGYIDLLRGDLPSALRRMDSARTEMAALGPSVTAVNDLDRAQALDAAGLSREAIGLLRNVRQRLATTDLWRFQCDIEIQLARMTEGPEAIALADAAARRYTQHGNEVQADRARAVALRLRSRSADPPPPDEVERLAARLLASGRKEEARALHLRLAGLRGEMPKPIDEHAPLATRLLAGEVGAEVALAHGDTAEALGRAATAVDELEEWQRAIGSLELQDSTFTLGAPLIRLGQQAALASGDPAVLLEWSERARAVASRGVPSRPPDELGDLLAQLRHLGPEGDTEQRASLIEQIRHGRWHAEGWIAPERALTLDRLQNALGTARFVSIMAIDDQVIALVVEGEAAQTHRLGPWERLRAHLAGLEADLALAAQSTSRLVRRSLTERLVAIDTILRPPFDSARDVVLTVPDELARVPWGQLPGLRDVAVTLPVSAIAWVRAAGHPPAAGRSVAVVVGPDTHTGTDEADAVAGAWAGAATTTVLPEATCEEVRDLAGKVDVLHISAHGRDRDGHRLFAATELYDGEWFGHDIELLPRVPEIVVLSACGVGGGSLGMARAWLHAGARHVIAAPADISEAAAAARFPRFHALIAGGVAPERATAEAFGPDAVDCAVQCYGPSPSAGLTA